MELQKEQIKKSKHIYRSSVETTPNHRNHIFQPSNSLTTSNHMQIRKNHHCSYKWGITPHQSPQHFQLRQELKYLKLRHERKKFAPKREGPFTITEVLNPLNYHLSLPENWRIHPIFHATLLSPFKHTEIHGENFIWPPPDLIEGQPEYEVEAIISHQRNGKGKAYLVK